MYLMTRMRNKEAPGPSPLTLATKP
jgi:hypothetical protein